MSYPISIEMKEILLSPILIGRGFVIIKLFTKERRDYMTELNFENILEQVKASLDDDFDVDSGIQIEIDGKQYAFGFEEHSTESENVPGEMYVNIIGEGILKQVGDYYDYNSFPQGDTPKVSDLISAEELAEIIFNHLQ